MADKQSPPSDDSYDNAARQQAAEHHEPEADEPLSTEMIESLRAHHETDAELPVDEREHKHDTGPLSE